MMALPQLFFQYFPETLVSDMFGFDFGLLPAQELLPEDIEKIRAVGSLHRWMHSLRNRMVNQLLFFVIEDRLYIILDIEISN